MADCWSGSLQRDQSSPSPVLDQGSVTLAREIYAHAQCRDGSPRGVASGISAPTPLSIIWPPVVKCQMAAARIMLRRISRCLVSRLVAGAGVQPYLAAQASSGRAMLWPSVRRSDVIRLGWQHVRGDKIALRKQKTDTPLLLPIARQLAGALEDQPRKNLTFVLTAFGAPFTFNGLGNWFRARCNEAWLRQCSAHGLRKLAATRMGNAGCTDLELMAVFVWRSTSEVRRYTRGADQARLAEQAFEKVRGGMKGEQKLSNLPIRLDKTASN